MPAREPFPQRLAAAVRRTGVPGCVGIDPHLDRLPDPLVGGLPSRGDPGWPEAVAGAVEAFGLGVVDAVAEHVPAVKPQVAFFEALGWPGVRALEAVCRRAREQGLLVVLDAKRGDIGSTARAYVQGTLDDDGPLGADAVTLAPWLGPESMGPFLERTPEKGLFVLVRTSNPGAGPWQVEHGGVAERVAAWVDDQSARHLDPDGLGPVGAVVAATVPREAAAWRARLPHAWLLVPGFGAQGGGLDDVRPLVRPDGLGALINSSRGVLFGDSPREGGDWSSRVRSRARSFAERLRPLGPV